MDQLLEMILRGDLKIGDKLPSERQLAEMTKVSRSVVNSGIVELEECGFLTVKPRSGTYVADYRKAGNLDTLVLLLKTLSKEPLYALFGGHYGADAVRYFLVVGIAGCVWPMTFPLFARLGGEKGKSAR